MKRDAKNPSLTALKNGIERRLSLIEGHHIKIDALIRENESALISIRSMLRRIYAPYAPTKTGRVAKDRSEYLIDDRFFGKSKFVLEFAKKQLAGKKSLKQIKAEFPDELGIGLKEDGSPKGLEYFGVFQTLEKAKEKDPEGKRYYMSPKDIFKSKDGVEMVVSTQWSVENFFRFMKVVQQEYDMPVVGRNVTPKALKYSDMVGVKIAQTK